MRVQSCLRLDRFSREMSSKEMPFPHPQARKGKHGKEDIPSRPGILGNVFERAVNVPDDRDAEDKVSPAKNRTFRVLGHDVDG